MPPLPYSHAEHYADDLEEELDDALLQDFNVEAEDNSPQEVRTMQVAWQMEHAAMPAACKHQLNNRLTHMPCLMLPVRSSHKRLWRCTKNACKATSTLYISSRQQWRQRLQTLQHHGASGKW